jgi:hypothetical protein
MAGAGMRRSTRRAFSPDRLSAIDGWMFVCHVTGNMPGRFHFGLFFVSGLPDMR